MPKDEQAANTPSSTGRSCDVPTAPPHHGRAPAAAESVRDLWPMAKELGVPMISSPENIAKLAEILGIEQKERLRAALTDGIEHAYSQRQLLTSERPRSSPMPVDAGAVTISTNMAGRGVDILLGGRPENNPNWEAEGQKCAPWWFAHPGHRAP